MPAKSTPPRVTRRQRVPAQQRKAAPRRTRRAGRQRAVWFGRLAFGGGIVLFALSLYVFFAPLPNAAKLFPELDVWRSTRAACEARSGIYEKGFCFPAMPQACIQQQGTWGLMGASVGQGCNRLAPDAGRVCTRGNQCSSGVCAGVLTLSDQQRLSELQRSSTPSVGIRVPGRCAGFLRVFGCFAPLTDGKATRVDCRK